MSTMRNQHETLTKVFANELFDDQQQDQTTDCCCNTIPHIKQKLVQIISTLELERQEFLHSSNRKIESLQQDTIKMQKEKDQMIEQLKYQLMKLIAVKNELKRTFDLELEQKNRQIDHLKYRISTNVKLQQTEKSLFSETKDCSISRKFSKQIYSSNVNSGSETGSKISFSPTCPSVSSFQNRSIPLKSPLVKKMGYNKFLQRSRNIQSTLNLISRVKSRNFQSQQY